MQWWMRPGPRRACASAKPPPRGPSSAPAGTSTPSKRISECEIQPAPVSPITGSRRTCSTPGASVGTSSIEARSCGFPSGSVTAITMVQADPSKPVVNHLWPSRRQPVGVSVAVVESVVGLEPACSGSVIAKQERTDPSRSGSRKVRFWSSVAKARSSSALPMSGACPFVAQWPSGLQPSASDTRP